MRLRHLALAAFVAMTFLAAPASAQFVPDDLSQRVVEAGEGSTYLNLIALAFPGGVRDGDEYHAPEAFQLRHISDDPDRDETVAAGTLLTAPGVLLVRSEGHKRLAMLLGLGQPEDSAEGIAALALFDIDGKPKLLDLANVSYDRETGFFDPGTLTLRDGGATLLIASTHSNSNQTYPTYVMIDLRGDRFSLIDTFFLLNDNGCGFEHIQHPRFSATGSPKKPAIQITVTDATTRRREDCDTLPLPQTGKRKISVTYEWEPRHRKYRRSSDALERLAKEATERL